MLACPIDCCLEHACPFLADLVCNDTSCYPFMNVTHCEYGEGLETERGSTVQGREVKWIFGFSEVVALQDQDTGIISRHYLNKTAKPGTPQAVCQCLQDFATVVLRKDFGGSCLNFRDERMLRPRKMWPLRS